MRALCGLLACWAVIAFADPGGRLPATGGVVQVEGAGGGGLSQWALISGYGTNTEWGGGAAVTVAELDDFRLSVIAVNVGLFDTVELSLAEQRFDLQDVVPGETLRQHIAGIKWRVWGDAVFSDSPWLPQLSVAAYHKRNRDFDFIPVALGARDDSDTEWVLSASRLWFAALAGRNLLLNVSGRYSRANQFGLLGFGGDDRNGRRWLAEASVGVFLTDALLLGAEYRQKPDLLSGVAEQDAHDLFLAYVPSRHWALTAAWLSLGDIAGQRDQQGAYLSLQLNF